MSNETDVTAGKEKEKRKRPSKGMRKHNRKVKQETRKASVPGSEVNKRTR